MLFSVFFVGSILLRFNNFGVIFSVFAPFFSALLLILLIVLEGVAADFVPFPFARDISRIGTLDPHEFSVSFLFALICHTATDIAYWNGICSAPDSIASLNIVSKGSGFGPGMKSVSSALFGIRLNPKPL